METISDTPKFYILQQCSSDKMDNIRKTIDECMDIYYYDDNGQDKVWLCYPERATRYKTIGEAMKVSARLSTENKGVYFKAIPIYNPDTISKKPKSK